VNQGYLKFPFGVGTRGRVRTTAEDDHIRDLILQVLFTSPGERVNRPDFGCGLKSLLFMPNSDVLSVATQFMVQGALQQWLGERITVETVKVRAEENLLTVDVIYVRKTDGERRYEQFVTGP
jgi:phage baseplate assembly protein W